MPAKKKPAKQSGKAKPKKLGGSVRVRGQMIYAERLRRGWNQNGLAKAVKCSINTIIKAENGGPTTLGNLKLIADKLGIKLELLIDKFDIGSISDTGNKSLNHEDSDPRKMAKVQQRFAIEIDMPGDALIVQKRIIELAEQIKQSLPVKEGFRLLSDGSNKAFMIMDNSNDNIINYLVGLQSGTTQLLGTDFSPLAFMQLDKNGQPLIPDYIDDEGLNEIVSSLSRYYEMFYTSLLPKGLESCDEVRAISHSASMQHMKRMDAVYDMIVIKIIIDHM